MISITSTSTWYSNSRCKLTGKIKKIKYMYVDMEQFVDNDHSSHEVFYCVFDTFYEYVI